MTMPRYADCHVHHTHYTNAIPNRLKPYLRISNSELCMKEKML